MHIVVVDDDGSVTGVRGNILEKHVALSKAKDAVSQVNSPQKIWYKNYLANFSEYLYAGGNQSTTNDNYHNTFPTSTVFTEAATATIYQGADPATTFSVHLLSQIFNGIKMHRDGPLVLSVVLHMFLRMVRTTLLKVI